MKRIAEKEIFRFSSELLAAAGVNADQAASVARNIAWNELDGRSNFGLERMPIYIARLQKKALNGDCRPSMTSPAPSLVLVDGDNGFGQFTGEVAMRAAIEAARKQGAGAAFVRRSNFYGSGAYFIDLACAADMVGLALSNSFAKVAAAGGQTPVLGTNPFAFGAPRRGGRRLIVDFATSSMAGSSVRRLIEKGGDLTEGQAIDKNGKPVTDPRLIGEASLTPFGGVKGFGLALMVETLAGVLAGAAISTGVGSLYHDFEREADSGHFFAAINVESLMAPEDFLDRMESMAALVCASGENVRLPGAGRASAHAENKKIGALIGEGTLAKLDALAEKLAVRPLS